MKNDKNICLRRILACLSVLLTIASQPVQADEFGLIAGAESGYQRLALNYQTAPKWRGVLGKRPLDASLEYSLGMVRANSGRSDRELLQAGITLFARWWFAPDTGIELGSGANVFSGTHLGNKNISTAFQFGSSIGLFHRLQGTPWQLGLRLTHYSNAGIKNPNPGQNYLQLRASYVLPIERGTRPVECDNSLQTSARRH